jgi:Protein of unknown function (DUF2934)
MDIEQRQRIERRAYAVWEAEGHPDGRHEEHWLAATRQIEAEDSGRPAEKPKKRRNGGSSARKKSKR